MLSCAEMLAVSIVPELLLRVSTFFTACAVTLSISSRFVLIPCTLPAIVTADCASPFMASDIWDADSDASPAMSAVDFTVSARENADA